MEQLDTLHVDPVAGRRLHPEGALDFTGVGLTHAGSRPRQTDAAFLQFSVWIGNRVGEDEDRLRGEADYDLQAGRPSSLARRIPLHWPLTFPEVLVDRPDPGFDAIIGNDYLAWLQRWDGGGTKGETDLAARFTGPNGRGGTARFNPCSTSRSATHWASK